MNKNVIIGISILIGLVFLISQIFYDKEPIDYNTQVKPILNKHCISCHGGVKQAGGFSLMTRDLALQATESGAYAIIPEKAGDSEMIRRLHLDDPDERMPKNAPALTSKEIEVLTQWIKEGAEWGLHWAYQPLTHDAQKLQEIRESSLAKSKIVSSGLSTRIDYHAQQELKANGLTLNAEAQRAELLRRSSMDLIGIPAPASLAEAFVPEESEMTFEAVIDELMSLPAFGEKWASMWLDVARYADSRGFERDQHRSIWAYRDYVIQSLNDGKPFDDFIIEQMAGDLLANPSDEQLIATGFHRNTPTNDEGGTDNEEYRVRAVMDRVGTTWSGLMGTTMACVQCHGHPYDPFPHETFYQSFAYLNNTNDADTGKDYPHLKLLDSLNEAKLQDLQEWISSVATNNQVDEITHFIKTGEPAIYSSETDELENADIYDTKYLGLRKNGTARIPSIDLTGMNRIVFPLSTNQNHGVLTLHLDAVDGPKILKLNLSKTNGNEFYDLPLKVVDGVHDLYLKYENSQLLSNKIRAVSFDWFHFAPAFPGSEDPAFSNYKELYSDLIETESPHTLIMSIRPKERWRETHVFDRGNWLTHNEKVIPTVPDVLPDMRNEKDPDRLAFAKWIVADENPLTARTMVNRVWQELWGNGIVLTSEDLGSQGAVPSHPELLNDMAYTWMKDYNWNLKPLLKSIMLTDVYQQAAVADDIRIAKDPYNQLLSRGPRTRLSAEQIRDQALAISGLLSNKMYGPPVMPLQPEGIWETPYNNHKWVTSQGSEKYRRAVYTYIKRSSIYPSMVQFDMGARSVCEPRRLQTNTPLQALVTLNDPAFIEASTALAQRMLEEGGDSISDQINYAYQLAMHQHMSQEKLAVLEQLYIDAKELLDQESMSYADEAHDIAMTTVANAILNLDEILNK